MKKPIVLFLVSMLVVCQLVLAEVPTGSMTTYVVGGNDIEEAPIEESDESGMGMITSFSTSPSDEQPDIPDDLENEAGVTPDSPLYGLERAIESISLAFTFGKSAKAKKGLAYARERLMEMQVMVLIDNEEGSAEAQAEYTGIMEDVNQEVASITSIGTEQEFQDEVEIENAINEQSAILQGMNVELQARGLSIEQQAQLTTKILNMEASIIKTKFNVQAKKEATKLKIQAKKSLTADQLSALEAQVIANIGERTKVKFTGKPAKTDLEYREDKSKGKNSKDIENNSKNSKGKAKGKNK